VRATAPASFPPGLTLALASPHRFLTATRGANNGEWHGPRFDHVSIPGRSGLATISWSVALDTASKSAEAASLGAVTLGFPEDQRGQIAVPHMVGGTQVGTIQGFYVLKVAANTPENARAETTVAFPLGQGVFAVARFALLNPASDEYRLEGGVFPTSWNRGQAFIAVAGVRVEGNFAPALASIRAERGTRLVRGRVVDAFRHRVVGARITLERRTGSGWRRVGRARTDKRGNYVVAAPSPGRYRVSASVGTVTVQSTSVGVR
jgi:Carboxypeptidase regulatory-like domain